MMAHVKTFVCLFNVWTIVVKRGEYLRICGIVISVEGAAGSGLTSHGGLVIFCNSTDVLGP